VDAASSGDDILVAAGHYTDVFTRSFKVQVVYISETVRIRGGYTTAYTDPPDPDSNRTTLDAEGQGRVLYIDGVISPTIEGLRITGGDATNLSDEGGGVFVSLWGIDDVVTISNCVIYGNTASTYDYGYGGGVFLDMGYSAVLNNNAIVSNTASTDDEGYGGGVYFSWGWMSATLSGNTVTSNTATTAASCDGYGGGLYVELGASIMFSDNTVVSNTASTGGDGYGGGLYAEGDTVLRGNTIRGNIASTSSGAGDEGEGGGLHALAVSPLMMSGDTVEGNIASTNVGGKGGGLYLEGCSGALTGSTFISNTASVAGSGNGGGLYVYISDVTLSDNTIAGNVASRGDVGYGGGSYLDSSDGAELSGNTVEGNTGSTGGPGVGGGLFLSGSDAAVISNTIVSNVGTRAGDGGAGGLHLYQSAATVSGNTIRSNIGSTAGGSGLGGGVNLYDSDGATLSGNTIVSNTAALNPIYTGHGGGVRVRRTDSFAMTNNIVADNHANTQGSGLWFGGESGDETSGRLLHTTIADNHSSGQGVYVDDYATVAFTNTIIAGHNSVGVCVDSGATATLEATLWYDNGAHTSGVVDIGSKNIYNSPAFVNPAAWDYHISPASFAVDAGVYCGVDTDIDDQARPRDGEYDIGADELNYFVYLPLVLRQY
jgi:hypothetical protein